MSFSMMITFRYIGVGRKDRVPEGSGVPEESDPPEGGCVILPTTLPGGLAGSSGS